MVSKRTWFGIVLVLAGAGCKTVTALLPSSGGGSGGAPRAPAPRTGSLTPRSDAADRALAERADERRKTLASVVTIDAAPGVPRVGPTRPTWCEALTAEDLKQSSVASAGRLMSDMKERGYWWNHTPSVLFYLCVSPDDEEVKKQTGHFLQYWANLTGLGPAELTPFFRAFVAGPNSDQTRYQTAMADACKSFPQPSDEASPRDRALKAAERASIGCADRDGTPMWVNRGTGPDISWSYDLRAEPPSELLRSYVVLRCLQDADDLEDQQLAAYGVCGADARGLSGAKLEQEIAAYPELSKALARQQHAVARKVAARYEAAAQARSKQDPAWKTLLYDAPARAWQEWDGLYKRHQTAIEAARAYENVVNGPSRKAAKGCWKDAWAHFRGYVATGKPGTLDEARRVMTAPVATILLEHLVACAHVEDLVVLSPATRLFEAARPARGPRFASVYTIIDALYEIRSDRTKLDADPRWFASAFNGRSPLGGGNGSVARLEPDDKGGVVKSVKPVDGGVLVEFKTERWQEDKVECEDTSRVRMIKADGTLVYDRKCKDLGKEWVESTHFPVWVSEDLAAGIKPGSFVRLFSGGGPHKATGAQISAPIEVWDGKERKRLVAYFGVPLS